VMNICVPVMVNHGVVARLVRGNYKWMRK
jgi:hypothetical protein